MFIYHLFYVICLCSTLSVFTDRRKRRLKRCKVWYLEGTFEEPKVHAVIVNICFFLRVGQEIQQVPLAFLLIFQQTFKAYLKILPVLHDMFSNKETKVKEVICDGKAVWQAVRKVIRL